MVFSIVSSMSRKKYEQDKVEDEGSGEGSGKWDLYIPQGPAALPQEPSAKHGASSDSDDEVDAWENLQVLENDSSKSLSTGFRESMRRMGIAEAVKPAALAFSDAVADVANKIADKASSVADTVAHGVTAPARGLSRRSFQQHHEDDLAGTSPTAKARHSWLSSASSARSKFSTSIDGKGSASDTPFSAHAVAEHHVAESTKTIEEVKAAQPPKAAEAPKPTEGSSIASDAPAAPMAPHQRRERGRRRQHASDIARLPFQSIHYVAKASVMRLQQLLQDASAEAGPLESKLPPRKSSSCPNSSKLLHVPEESALPAEEPLTELSPRRSSQLSGTASLPAKLMTEAAAAEEEGVGGVAQTDRLDVQSTMGTLFVNQYVVIQNLGSGTFGKVKLALNLFDEELYAIKLVNKGRAKRRNVGHVRQARDAGMLSQMGALSEVEVLRNLDHPNLVKLFEVIDDPNSDKLLMVMEYVEGGAIMSLESSWSVVNPLPEDSCRIYFREAHKGLWYLHANLVVHGDIKPDNLLLSADGNVKIADFGSSRLLAGTGTLERTIGTPAYLAPEIVAGQPYHGRQADIWALGVTLYVLLTGRMPFKGRSFPDLYDAILAAEYNWPEEVTVSPAARNLVDAILRKDPEQRLTLADMGKHPWTTGDGRFPPPQDEESDDLVYQPVTTTTPAAQVTTRAFDSIPSTGDPQPMPPPSAFAHTAPPLDPPPPPASSSSQTERVLSTALPPHDFLSSASAGEGGSRTGSGHGVVPGDLARSFIQQHDDPQGLMLYDEARNRSLARWEKSRRKMRGQLEPYYDYQDFEMGAWVVQQGDPIEAMFMIRDGQVELWQDRRVAEEVRVSDSDLDEEVSEEEDGTLDSRSSSHTAAAPEISEPPQGVLPSRRSIRWRARVGTAGLASSVASHDSVVGSYGAGGYFPEGAVDTTLRTIPSVSASSDVAEAQVAPSLYRPSPLFRVSVSNSVAEEPDDAVVSVRSAGEFLLGSVWGSNTVNVKAWVLQQRDYSWEYSIRCKTPVSLLVFRRGKMLRALQEKPHLQLGLQAAVARSQSEALRASILDHLSLRKLKAQSFSKTVRKRTALQQNAYSVASTDGLWRSPTGGSEGLPKE